MNSREFWFLGGVTTVSCFSFNNLCIFFYLLLLITTSFSHTIILPNFKIWKMCSGFTFIGFNQVRLWDIHATVPKEIQKMTSKYILNKKIPPSLYMNWHGQLRGSHTLLPHQPRIYLSNFLFSCILTQFITPEPGAFLTKSQDLHLDTY